MEIKITFKELKRIKKNKNLLQFSLWKILYDIFVQKKGNSSYAPV